MSDHNTVPNAPRLNPATIPAQLLARYQANGPRYTSYPTAPHFSSEFDEEAIGDRWRSSGAAGNALSLYVHLPFCRQRCLYCGCYTEIGHNEATMSAYGAALIEESDRHSSLIGRARPIMQLALGGGTPVSLSPQLMTRLLSGLESHWSFDVGCERSIEIDPRAIDTGYLDMLIDLGFNRFSFGVQDLDETVQRMIGREMPVTVIRTLVNHLIGRGRHAINLDLMYGLPGQTRASFDRTVREVIELKPSRLAVFGYAHVPWVSPHQRAFDGLPLPQPDERMALLGIAYDLLLDAGYVHIGMDHFALPSDELAAALKQRTLTRNFMGYTTRRGLDLIGLGASAISSVGATYTQNVKSVATYLERHDVSPWFKGLMLKPEDVLRREIILDLFCNFYLDVRAIERTYAIKFQSHFAAALEALQPMVEDKLATIDGDSIAATDLGRFFIRNICMKFDQYLQPEASESKYSKTI